MNVVNFPLQRRDEIRSDPLVGSIPPASVPEAIRRDVAAPCRVVAVVVTHDRLALLRRCVAALLSEPDERLAILLVVDNASQDGTADWLAGVEDPRLRVLRLPGNAGGAGGFEAGLRLAMHELAPDWVLLMDDDACPQPDALMRFHALDRAGWDGIAAAVLSPDGAPCDTNRPTLDPFRRPSVLAQALSGHGREAFHLGPKAFAEVGQGMIPIDGASFVGLFLSKAAIQRAGYPDGRLFLYGDDAMFTLGMSRAGLRLGFAPSVRFRHDLSTYSLLDPRIRPLWKVYYRHRNLVLLYQRLAGWLFWPVLALYLPLWILRARHYRGERSRFLALLRLALHDGITGDLSRPHSEVRTRSGLSSGPAPPPTSGSALDAG